MVCLRAKDGPAKGTVYPLRGESVIIGRDNEAQIQVIDQGVSRRHAEVFCVGEMYFIRDLGSRNGTYVNEERIGEELLREGDRIRIGQTTLTFEDRQADALEDAPDIEFSHADADPGATMEFRFGVMDMADLEEPVVSRSLEDVRSQESARLSVLYQVARAVSTERDAKKMLLRVIALCSQAVGASHGYIFAQSGGVQRKELDLEAAYEKDASDAPVVSTTIIRRVFRHGRAILTSDAASDARFSGRDSVILGGIRSVICAPLVAMEQVLGVIYLCGCASGRGFAKDDLELASAIGIQAGAALKSLRLMSEQGRMFTSIISTLVSAVEMHSPHLKGSSERVARFAEALAKAVGLPQEEVNSVGLAALLHDIGRLSISEGEIILSQAARTREDALEYKQAVRSCELLGNIEGLRDILPAVRHSFERYDGGGYPDGLAGEGIPLQARIIAVARAFDHAAAASTGEKAHVREALLELNALAQQGQLDPKLVQAMAVAFRTGLLDDAG